MCSERNYVKFLILLIRYRNLRGRRLIPDPTPAHLKILRDAEEKPGLSMTSDPKWESAHTKSASTLNGATTKVGNCGNLVYICF